LIILLAVPYFSMPCSPAVSEVDPGVSLKTNGLYRLKLSGFDFTSFFSPDDMLSNDGNKAN